MHACIEQKRFGVADEHRMIRRLDRRRRDDPITNSQDAFESINRTLHTKINWCTITTLRPNVPDVPVASPHRPIVRRVRCIIASWHVATAWASPRPASSDLDSRANRPHTPPPRTDSSQLAIKARKMARQDKEEGREYLTAESKAFLARTFPPGCARQRDLPVDAGRALMESALRQYGGPYPSVRRVEDIRLRARDGQGHFAIRVYWPRVPDSGATERLPVLLYAHGGGWVKGSANTHDQLCRRLALGSDRVVVAVDYRLSPEARFPQALEDLEVAFDWVHGQVQMDPTDVCVSGDSAGGNLVAGFVVRLLRRGGEAALAPAHRVKKQALIYPVLDLTMRSGPSYQKYGEGFGLSNASIEYYVEAYLGLGGKGPGDPKAKDPEASPLFFEGPMVAALPATLLVSARADPLLSDAEVGASVGWGGVVCMSVRFNDNCLHKYV